MSNALIDLTYRTLSGNKSDKVSSDIRENRLNICKSCYLDNGVKGLLPTGNCRVCGCFVKLKTEYKAEKCPLNKWNKEVI